MEEFTVTVRNYPYRIRETGEGKAFIWLHGMFHSLESEDVFSVFNFDILSRYIRLIRIELPAHGQSPLAGDSSRLEWPSIAADIRELAQMMNIRQYNIGGFSQGAGIAAHAVLGNRSATGLVMAMLPKIWDKRAAVIATYRKLFTQLKERQDTEILKKALNLGSYPPEQILDDSMVSGRIREIILSTPIPNLLQILEGAIASDMPPAKTIEEKSAQLKLLLGWTNDPNHPYDIYGQVDSILEPDDCFLLDPMLNVKSATFRLLSFLFTSL